MKLKLRKIVLEIPVIYNCFAYEEAINRRNCQFHPQIFYRAFLILLNNVSRYQDFKNNYFEKIYLCLCECQNHISLNISETKILTRMTFLRYVLMNEMKYDIDHNQSILSIFFRI